METRVMQALRLHSFSSWRELVLETVPVPVPAGGKDVLVQVKAAGLNPVDLKICAGKGTAQALEGGFPVGLGFDLAGDVVAAGALSEFAVGDRVCGMVGFPGRPGACAQYVVASSTELVSLPVALSYEQGAALPLVGLTAYQALLEIGSLQAGETVLITGASGGVGRLLLQLARRQGAFVIGSCSARSMEACNALGAQRLIDYTTESLSTLTESIDLIVNCVTDPVGLSEMPGVGGHTRRISIVSLAPSDKALNEFFSQRMLVRPDLSQLRKLLALVEQGELCSHIAGSYPFHEFATACQLLDTGHAGGKVLLRPSGSVSGSV